MSQQADALVAKWRAIVAATHLERETIARVPLGLSRDYDRLAETGPLCHVRCSPCGKSYADVERLMADGCRVMAAMCGDCREKGRAQWIAENRVELPRAVARRRTWWERVTREQL
jgi:hypothetical protein